MALVIGASVTACWFLPDEVHAVAEQALERIQTENVIVPSIWWYEVRNILVINERRKRITEKTLNESLRLIRQLPVTIVSLPNDETPVELARRYRLTAYDAAYLELAIRNQSTLASLDNALNNAAMEENIVLLGD